MKQRNIIVIIVFLISFKLVMPQDAKPTKEQTISFIQNWFNNKKEFFINGRSGKYFYNISINNCLINIKKRLYNNSFSDGWAEDYSYEWEFDLSKIEKIEKVLSSNTTETLIYFYSINNSPSIKYKYLLLEKQNITIKSREESNNWELKSSFLIEFQYVDNRLIDALNYLRKLCGAPDPISFK